jgi:hypothetical protein
MRQIADVHYRALKPGRHAVFETMNVQGKRRDQLETALVDAGFFLPFFEVKLWYRQALRQTGIPHMFVLGRPHAIRWDSRYSEDQDLLSQDSATLAEISAECQMKLEAELENEQSKLTDESRTAEVVYSTG